VAEYAEGGTLRNHLEKNFLSLNRKEKYELALQLSTAIGFLHKKGIVHKNLHSKSILIHQNSIKLADSGLSKRIKDSSRTWLDTIPYADPQGFDIEEMFSDTLEEYELNEKSDVYSVGVLLWELSSGKKPFSDKEYDSILAKEIAQELREVAAEGTSEDYRTLYESKLSFKLLFIAYLFFYFEKSVQYMYILKLTINNLLECWNGDPDKRPTIQEVVATLKSITSLELGSSPSKQKLIIQQFNLNHGLFLDGHSIEPSKHAVFTESGELKLRFYDGQPLVYTSINDRKSRKNSLSFNSGDNNVKLNESLRPSDICINFPVAEITYTANLSSTFSNFMDDEKLYEMHGHLFPRRIIIGGKLFIDGLKSATSTQIDMFKSFLTWIYDLARYNKEIPFKNLPAIMNFFPKIITTDGENLNTHEELIDWMNNLYQDDAVEIISYNNLIPISQLKSDTISLVDEIQSIQSGVANFKEELTLENWAEDSIYITIIRWIKKFQLLQGLIVDRNFKLRISKKKAIDLINIPDVNSNDKFYLKIVKPTTILEEILINNNTNSDEDMSSFPFIKVSDDPSYDDCVHFLVKVKDTKFY
jgi:serine/threonine protein kinase